MQMRSCALRSWSIDRVARMLAATLGVSRGSTSLDPLHTATTDPRLEPFEAIPERTPREAAARAEKAMSMLSPRAPDDGRGAG